jgi:hypothetical protein
MASSARLQVHESIGTMDARSLVRTNRPEAIAFDAGCRFARPAVQCCRPRVILRRTSDGTPTLPRLRPRIADGRQESNRVPDKFGRTIVDENGMP